MEKAVHPVVEEDDSFSCTKKLKGSPVFDDMGFTLFTDSGYKLPLYLSEFALGEFNSNKKTMYEKVNVVEPMKSLDVEKGTTYLITFKASSPDNKSNNAQTFETNIFMSPLDPTAKIEIKFVRIKPSELDYNGKEDSEEKVSESDEKNFNELSEFDEEDTEKKLSESDEKDNEEKFCESDGKDSAQEMLSEFDVKDSAEEKLVESDEKDNKENLFESDEKDTEEKLSKFEGKDSAEEKVAEFNVKNSAEEMLAEFNEKKSEEEKLILESNMKLSEEEKLNKFDEENYELSDSDDEYKEGSEYSKEIKQYRIDVEKSDGFEVGYYPHVRGFCCMIRRYYDPPAKTLSIPYLNELVRLSQLAICVYNMKEVTYYDNVRVIKAMTSGCGGTTYNITFEASLSDGNAITFQTRLYASLPFPYHEIEIDFVRIKPVINPDINN